MLKILRVFLVALLSWSSPTFAGMNHGNASSNGGSSQFNIGEIQGAFINVLKIGSNSLTANYNPAEFDDSGYPKTTVTVGPLFQIPMSVVQTTPATVWVLKWPATRSFSFYINNAINISFISGCTNSLTTVITGTNGVACRVEFTFGSKTTSLQVGIPSGVYTTGSGEVAFVRKSDESAYDAGEYFTPELLANYRTLNPKTFRTMPWTSNSVFAQQSGANVVAQVKWAYRSRPEHMTWTTHFPNGTWAGATTEPGMKNQYISNAAPDTPLTWTANEVIQVKFNSAPTNLSITGAISNGGFVQLTVTSTSTLSNGQAVWNVGINGTTEANGKHAITTVDDSTHVTIDVAFSNSFVSSPAAKIGTATLSVTGKSGGAKFIGTSQGAPLYYNNGSAPLTASYGTLFYDALLDVLVWTNGGVSGMPPIEAQVDIANRIKANLWISIPLFVDDDYISSLTAQVRDSLSSGLIFYPEYGNEIWNTVFPATNWAIFRGLALGLPFTNSRAVYGWYGLRMKQVMGLAYSAWTISRSASSLRRVMAFQAFGVSDNTTYRFNGTDLASVANGGQGNATWVSYTGNANYTAAPNRPIDAADVFSYATYFSGANFTNFDANYTTTMAPFLQNLADLYESGSPSDLTTALALLDNDFRQGTLSTSTQSVSIAGGTTFTASATNFTNNQTVVGTTTGTFFTGLSLNTPYFVVNVSGSTFKLALTQGGAAITGISGGTGTQSFGVLGNQTLLGLSSKIYRNVLSSANVNPGWEAVASTYDTARAGFTPALPPLRVELYEGGLEAAGPSAAVCTTLGITVGGSAATASANLAALLLGYKQDTTYGRGILVSQFNQFMGLDPISSTFGVMAHSKTPSWFLDAGPTQWSLMYGDIPSNLYLQTFFGFSGYRSGINWLLNRDLNPASNDNSPMFLEKVA